MKPANCAAFLGIGLLACGPATPKVFPDSGCDEACQEQSLRFGNHDYLVIAPGVWRFFDDYSGSLPRPPECGTGAESFGGMKPLWRRTLVAVSGNTNNVGQFYSRNSLSVASGVIAVNIGGIVWIIDAASGVPVHAWDSAYRDDGKQLNFYANDPFAALTPDGHMLWVSYSEAPALLDLRTVDRKTGVKFVFSWADDRPDDGSLITTDVFEWASPAVAPDGTFVWKSQDGHIRAADTTGRVKWDDFVRASGYAVVDADGNSYWTQGGPPLALKPDLSVKWAAERPVGFESGSSIEVERPGPRSYWPVSWYNVGERDSYLAAHSLEDGAILWGRKIFLTGRGLGRVGDPLSAQAADGTLYIAHRGVDEVGTMSALNGRTGEEKWTLTLPKPEGFDAGTARWGGGSEIWGGPIPTIPGNKKGGVYAVSRNCKVYYIDGEGEIRGWYQLGGVPFGHIPQLVDGVLYFLVRAPTDLSKDQRKCPGFEPTLALERYGCLHPSVVLCKPCIEGNRDMYYLYAFRVE